MTDAPMERLPDIRGYGLWRRREVHGGYSYWTDDIGGGRRIFDEGLDDWAILDELRLRIGVEAANKLDLPEPMNCEILGCELRLTCSACPEQYDVYRDGEEIGYLRLRHGAFRADYTYRQLGKVRKPPRYEASTIGDGCFEPGERPYHLLRAVHAILWEYQLENPPKEH